MIHLKFENEKSRAAALNMFKDIWILQPNLVLSLYGPDKKIKQLQGRLLKAGITFEVCDIDGRAIGSQKGGEAT